MKVKLCDAFDLQMGKTPSRNNLEYWNGGHKWVAIGDLGDTGKYISHTKECISDTGVAESGIKPVPAGTVIMSFKLSIGKTAITTEEIYTNEAIMAFIDKKVYPVDVNYIYHLFSGMDWSEGSNKAVMGITLNKATLSQKTINIPDMNEQRSVAFTLDKLDDLISRRKQQLIKLDKLVKARFVEMFGDPVLNPHDYPKYKLGELSLKISDGVHAKPEYVEKGRPFLSVVNINKRKVDFTDCKFVSEEAYQKMIKSTHPQKGDILYTKVGATYGIPAYIDTNREFCLYVSVCLIKPNHNLINSKFLAFSMDMPYIKMQADTRIKGIGVPDLHLNQISEFDILCPPRKMQDSFVSYVEHIERHILTIQQSLDKLKMLKKSLMQEYFG